MIDTSKISNGWISQRTINSIEFNVMNCDEILFGNIDHILPNLDDINSFMQRYGYNPDITNVIFNKKARVVFEFEGESYCEQNVLIGNSEYSIINIASVLEVIYEERIVWSNQTRILKRAMEKEYVFTAIYSDVIKTPLIIPIDNQRNVALVMNKPNNRWSKIRREVCKQYEM